MEVSRGAGETVVWRSLASLLVEGARCPMIEVEGCRERNFGPGSDVAGGVLALASRIVRRVDKTWVLA